AVLFALSIDNVLHAFLFTETIAAFVGIIFLGGVMWKRANRFGAAAAIIVSLVSYYWINYADIGEWMLVYKWEPEPFGWAILLGFAAFFIVSLLTRPEDPVRIEKFFDEMRRKSDAESLGPDGKLRSEERRVGKEWRAGGALYPGRKITGLDSVYRRGTAGTSQTEV